MRTRRVGATLLASVIVSCSWVAPSLPFSPTAVATLDDSTHIATVGCERLILSVRLIGTDTEFWRIEADDPDGSPLSTVTVGVTPDGFTEATPLDPAWVDAELFGRNGATVAFEAPESEPGLASMGEFIPSTGAYAWLFGDVEDAPGAPWEDYREFVSDESAVGGNACETVIPEPGG